MPTVPTVRKVQEKPKPYDHKPQKPAISGGPKTSAKPADSKKHQNLTLHNWMTVFAFVDKHPSMSQLEIVQHFATKADGALGFTQGTLSWKISEWEKLEAHVNAHPNALSTKWPCIVTHPDVEKALVMWVQEMEVHGESINGNMLQVKLTKFEEEFDVPERECLPGKGQIPSFCKAYSLKAYQWHGEAGSVDPADVEAEQKHVGAILASYTPCDQWNFDETGLFALWVNFMKLWM